MISQDQAETPDILGDGYTARTIELPADEEGPLVATLVRRRSTRPTGTAVLYIHGYVDYFFQTELADFYTGRGIDFYAIDLHKYGRSLRPHQTPYQMADVADYYAELDAAAALIGADGSDRLIVNAHSTGGLVAPLWLADRPPSVPGALMLNSPFLQLNANWATRSLAGPALSAVGRLRPRAVWPQPEGHYGESISAHHGGEWRFDTVWKPLAGVPLRLGWLAAVRRAQARIHLGLGLDMPILVMCSARSVDADLPPDKLRDADAVLDTDSIARWSTALGRCVTCVRVAGGMHDLVLSAPTVRARVFAEMARWLDAYRPA